MPFISTVRGTFGPQSENRGVGNFSSLAEFKRQNLSASAFSSGGTITTAGGYTIHTFTNVGSASFILSGLTTLDVEYLVIGGGGSGAFIGAGGGAGGYRSGSLIASSINNVSVGAGGASQLGHPVQGVSGDPSTFSSITSTGGGGGGRYQSGPGFPGQQLGNPGGSGGGTGGNHNGGGGGGAGAAGTPEPGYLPSTPVATGIPGQGHPGGGLSPAPADGSGYLMTGGAGLSSSITGSSVARGGGGGSSGSHLGPNYSGASGGSGGGGNGGPGVPSGGPRIGPFPGAVNTGGGGGGNGWQSNVPPASAGNGGPGIVIVRYLS